MKGVKNLTASVKARLQNVAAARGDDFNLLLLRYGVERLLYRLSQSRHVDTFVLKGAMLFAVWDDKIHRPTRDLDLLGFLEAEEREMTDVFREIVATPVVDDGLIFDAESVRAELIRENDRYGGIRVRVTGKLGRIEVHLQIDVGSGDAVTPPPEISIFPALLDFPAPHIRAYSVYTVFAEKFEAMAKLQITNTRMKDFFDLWFLSKNFELDAEVLRKAIEATFARRQTTLPSPPEPFTDDMAASSMKQLQWTAFIRRDELSGAPEQFGDVIIHLRKFIEPILT